ncbi:MAG: hypothetical protein ACE5HO_13050 [bacterium]
MTVKYVVLAEEIEREIENLKQVEEKVHEGVKRSQKHPGEREFYLDSVAMNLHSYYTGVENTFRSIASRVDGDVPQGERWHAELLSQMSTPLKEIREKVISDKTQIFLRELLGFRHLIRNIYSFHIDEERLLQLCERLQLHSKTLYSELGNFVEFLKKSGETS